MKDVGERLSASGQLLVRSGTEIERILETLYQAGGPVTAMLESGEQLFLSTLLEIDAQRRHVVIACSGEKHANSALLAAQAVLFACNHAATHYEFACASPQDWEHAGLPAIKLAFPDWVLGLQRRARARVQVPATVPLRCLIQTGPLSFEVHIVDISTRGLGSIVYDPAIHLKPGDQLKAARIMHPQADPIEVDLLVRHISRQAMPDGSGAMRAGCSFIGTPRNVEELIRLFVTELAP